MYCPKCRTEYRKGFSTCSDCEVALVPELPPEPLPPPAPEYVNFINLYSPQNEIEMSMLKSILDSEGIRYFVRNDNFGSLEVGPHIGLFNAKMIEVQDDQYEKAKELLADYLEKTYEHNEEPLKKYSMFDKIRMVIEFFLFNWVMPGKIKHKAKNGDSSNSERD
jgi:Putative prokaryotic signal transducing protein